MNSSTSIPVIKIFILLIIACFACTNQKTPPVITTLPASSISFTTAQTGGAITDEGGAAILKQGVCWNTKGSPTTYDNFKYTVNKGFGPFKIEMSDLSAKTKYFIRAFATNTEGISYGNELSFSTIQSIPPKLTTSSITTFDETSAVSGGNIISDNGDPVTALGVCWSTSTAPTVELNDKTIVTADKGIFSSVITPLLPNTKYYVRAYATNSTGTGYGNEVTVTTNPFAIPTLTTTDASLITPVTAVSGGNITSVHGSPVTVRGVCWSTATGPTASLATKTADGSGSGVFTSNISQLVQNTRYYLRAYATNAAGTAYGNEISFTTLTSDIPTLSTTVITSLSTTTALSGGNITSENGAAVTARGVCWSTSPAPTTALATKTIDGSGKGTFVSSITGLLSSQTYFLRAYATNSIGTAYGDEIMFTTKISDGEGNLYNVVKIGSQVWMAENLKVTKYNDNTSIPLVTGYSAWIISNTPAFCWYNNDEVTNKPLYGALYNWYVLDATSNGGKNACPTGWRVPTDTDWTILVNTLGDELSAGIALKEAGTTHWVNSVTGATNSTGFTALPAGIRSTNGGTFEQMGTYTCFWSSTDNGSGNSWYREFTSWYNTFVRSYYRSKSDGCSVRCVRTY